MWDMGFETDSDFSEVRRVLDELSEAITPNALLRWTNMIEARIRQECGADVEFKGEIERGQFNLRFDAKKAEDTDCVIRAIRLTLR
jgi:hypothetical protein